MGFASYAGHRGSGQEKKWNKCHNNWYMLELGGMYKDGKKPEDIIKKLLETIHIYFRARTDYSKNSVMSMHMKSYFV